MRTRTKAKLAGIVIVLLILAVLVNPACNFDTYDVTVTDKQVKRMGDRDVYLVFTIREDGRPRVFKNVDSKVHLKFNSSDLHALLRVNRRYRVKTAGWRWELKSWYENILKVEPLEDPNPS
jgi:hypothetical protein